MENAKISFSTFKEFNKDCFKYQIDTLPIVKSVYEKIDSLVLENMPDDIFYDLVYKISTERHRRDKEHNEREVE